MDTNKRRRHMAKEYEFHLAKRGKWICPECGHKTFVCYVDNDGNILNENVGKCDRANNCAYHYPPRKYFADNNIAFDAKQHRRTSRPMLRPQPRPTYIARDIFKQSVTATMTHPNNLVDYLKSVFGEEVVNEMAREYFIGTSKHFGGAATVFYQVDRFGTIHRGKVMQYDPTNGKRVKEPFPLFTTVHKLMNLGGDLPTQCLFGEHLLDKYPDWTVAIVESEKTALIGSCAYEGFLWVASGGCGNLTAPMCEALRGRYVYLFPDNGCFDKWKEIAKTALRFAKSVSISKTMELHATREGDDIGDLILADTWPEDMEFDDFLNSELVVL